MTGTDGKQQDAPHRLRRVAKASIRDEPLPAQSLISSPPPAALAPDRTFLGDEPSDVDRTRPSTRDGVEPADPADEAVARPSRASKRDTKRWSGKAVLFGAKNTRSETGARDRPRSQRKSIEVPAYPDLARPDPDTMESQTTAPDQESAPPHALEDPNTTIPLQSSSSADSPPSSPSSPSSLTPFAELMEEKNFWKQRFSEVNQEYLRTEKDSNTQLTGLKLTLETQISRLLSELDQARHAQHSAQRSLDAHQHQTLEHQRQILDLKRSISLSTRSESQVADDVFREQTLTLSHELQNWTITHFRRTRLVAPSSSPFPTSLLSLLPTHKLPFIQTLTSSLLHSQIFRPFFFGLPSSLLSALLTLSAEIATGSPSRLNAWRSSTLSTLSSSSDPAHLEALASASTAVTQHISDTLVGFIDADDGGTLSHACERGLEALVKSAVRLARLMSVQRAVLGLEAPVAGAVFEADAMEDVNGTLAEGEEGVIRCVTFPGVVKRGDEDGGEMHLRNVIVKAKVLVEPR
ncbi:MAG: hypothetical protein M1814_006553 [Vezdaea aestivalis]|nr:MAG: hypothetical protein M1814_006553 [Vezdaea aestivalis]